MIDFTPAEFRERERQSEQTKEAKKGKRRLSKMCSNAVLRSYKWGYESYPVIHYYSST